MVPPNRKLPVGVRANGVVAEVPQFPLINFHMKMLTKCEQNVNKMNKMLAKCERNVNKM